MIRRGGQSSYHFEYLCTVTYICISCDCISYTNLTIFEQHVKKKKNTMDLKNVPPMDSINVKIHC